MRGYWKKNVYTDKIFGALALTVLPHSEDQKKPDRALTLFLSWAINSLRGLCLIYFLFSFCKISTCSWNLLLLSDLTLSYFPSSSQAEERIVVSPRGSSHLG